MKLKSKLLLCATSLLTVSVAATATSAYAWFSAGNRTAYTAATGSTILTNTADLTVSVKAAVNDNGDTNTSGAQTVSGTTVLPITSTMGKVYDVSGDGKTFYQRALGEDGTVSSYQVVTNNITNSRIFYQQFNLNFKSSNENQTLKIVLDSATSAVGKTVTGTGEGGALTDTEQVTQDTNNNAANCVRMAFLDSSGNVICYYAPNETSAGKYIKSTVSDADDSKDEKDVDNTNTGIVANNILYGAFTTTTENNYVASTSKGILGDADSTTGLNITVRIWIEGTDADCISEQNETGTQNAEGGVFNTSFKFNALDSDITK